MNPFFTNIIYLIGYTALDVSIGFLFWIIISFKSMRSVLHPGLVLHESGEMGEKKIVGRESRSLHFVTPTCYVLVSSVQKG